jgi:hypothetical protein
MYRIADKYKSHFIKYTSTKLDINGIYPKDVWNMAGFMDKVLVRVR